jgi:hypothetical protein
MNHNPELILKYGDDMEKHWGEKILGSIPSYATIWATYIGNDGSQNFLPMPDADKNGLEERIAFWQRLYTLFESLALCWEIEREFGHRDRVIDRADYYRYLNSWTAFYAHLGRIHDMAEGITDQLDQSNLFAPFDPFYEKRHIALHGIKVPMCWAENVLCVPPLGEEVRQWHTKMNWGELNNKHFGFLSSQVCETLRDLERVIEGFCAQVFNLLTPRLGMKPVKWPQQVGIVARQKPVEVIFSGTQSCSTFGQSGVHNISGSSAASEPGGPD